MCLYYVVEVDGLRLRGSGLLVCGAWKSDLLTALTCRFGSMFCKESTCSREVAVSTFTYFHIYLY